jgi:hypothetical protein
MMKTTVIEDIWRRLDPVLKAFADRLVARDPALICDLGRTSNEVFPLRGYLALARSKSGDEIAVTIDVKSDGELLVLASDVCADQGLVIATGPSTTLNLSDDESRIDTGIGDWLRELEQFLVAHEAATATAVSRLR